MRDAKYKLEELGRTDGKPERENLQWQNQKEKMSDPSQWAENENTRREMNDCGYHEENLAITDIQVS